MIYSLIGLLGCCCFMGFELYFLLTGAKYLLLHSITICIQFGFVIFNAVNLTRS